MKTLFLIALIPTCMCVASACWMAMHGIEGWGWFLFVAAALGVSFNIGSTDDDTDDDDEIEEVEPPKETHKHRWN